MAFYPCAWRIKESDLPDAGPFLEQLRQRDIEYLNPGVGGICAYYRSNIEDIGSGIPDCQFGRKIELSSFVGVAAG